MKPGDLFVVYETSQLTWLWRTGDITASIHDGDICMLVEKDFHHSLFLFNDGVHAVKETCIKNCLRKL